MELREIEPAFLLESNAVLLIPPAFKLSKIHACRGFRHLF